jgi:hypothetical protein
MDPCYPATIGSGDGGGAFIANLNVNGVARFRSAPGGIGLSSLQDHVVTEDCADEGEGRGRFRTAAEDRAG